MSSMDSDPEVNYLCHIIEKFVIRPSTYLLTYAVTIRGGGAFVCMGFFPTLVGVGLQAIGDAFVTENTELDKVMVN